MKIETREKPVIPLELLPSSFTEESIKVQGLGLALECLSRTFRFLRESLAKGHLRDAELQENAEEMLDRFPALLDVLAEFCEDRKESLDSYVEDLRENIKNLKRKAPSEEEARS